MWYLYNPATGCYSTEKTLNGLNAKLGMEWKEVDRIEFMEAKRRGWVEYEPGKLRPPAPAEAPRGGTAAADDAHELANDSQSLYLLLGYIRGVYARVSAEPGYTAFMALQDVYKLTEEILQAMDAASE